MRESIVLLTELGLVLSTLLITMIAPAILVSPSDLDFAGDEARVRTFMRAVQWMWTASLINALCAFILSWLIFWQATCVPAGKALVFWLVRVRGTFNHVLFFLIFSIALYLLGCYCAAVGQMEPGTSLEYEAYGMMFAICALPLSYLGYLIAGIRIQWWTPPAVLGPELGPRVVKADLKEGALAKLRAMHDAATRESRES